MFEASVHHNTHKESSQLLSQLFPFLLSRAGNPSLSNFTLPQSIGSIFGFLDVMLQEVADAVNISDFDLSVF